jgi:hypothetical protein
MLALAITRIEDRYTCVCVKRAHDTIMKKLRVIFLQVYNAYWRSMYLYMCETFLQTLHALYTVWPLRVVNCIIEFSLPVCSTSKMQ